MFSVIKRPKYITNLSITINAPKLFRNEKKDESWKIESDFHLASLFLSGRRGAREGLEKDKLITICEI